MAGAGLCRFAGQSSTAMLGPTPNDPRALGGFSRNDSNGMEAMPSRAKPE
ncbi:MAG: hypothetical protein HGB36_07425 [Chlorobiaceae bacterium]|nr:hypothetical protein [Chlorobiaceae bacterium]